MTLDNGITQSAKRNPRPDSAGAAPEGKTDDRRTKGAPYPARPAQRATAAGKAKRASGSRKSRLTGYPAGRLLLQKYRRNRVFADARRNRLKT